MKGYQFSGLSGKPNTGVTLVSVLRNHLLVLVALVLLGSVSFADVEITKGAASGEPELIEVQAIWEKAPHNAFTGLVRFNGELFCAFREGASHVRQDGTDNGTIRVIRSSNGTEWTSAAHFTWEGGDLRDPQLSITGNGELMVNTSVAFYPATDYKPRQSVTWLSRDGDTFSGPHGCESGVNTWRWSVTWHEGYAYSIGYTGKDREGCLYRTSDGKTWKEVKRGVFPHGGDKYYNESSLVFLEDDTAYCLLRGDPHNALLGTSSPPYTDWDWRDLGIRIGGPKLFRLPDGRLVAAVRLHNPVRTSLCWIDPVDATLTEFMKLPSGGDTSYPGMVWYDDMLWVSYYSSHEGKAMIYLAKVNF